MRLGLYPARADARLEGRRGLRPGGHLRAPSPSLRGQQPVPPDARGGRHDPVRPVARRPAGRDRRAQGPPVVRGQPVPPGVQVAGPSGRTRCSTGSWPRRSRSATGASRSSPRAPIRRRRDAPRRPAGRGRCRRVRPQRLTSRSLRRSRSPSGRRIRRVDPRSVRRSAGRPGSPTALAWPLSLLIPANAIGAWLGVAFVARGVGPDDPDRRTARRHRAARRRSPSTTCSSRSSARAIGRSGRRTRRRSGARVALLAGPVMGGAGAVWRHGAGWPRAIGVGAARVRALRRRASSFGAPRLVHLDQLAHGPGRVCSSASRSSWASRCRWLLLRRGRAAARLRRRSSCSAVVAGAGHRAGHGVDPAGIGRPLLRRRRTSRRRIERHIATALEPARMKIFLDTADIEEIRTAARWGVLDGVTTNPTLYAKVGGSYDEILKEVCKITPGPGLGRGRRRRRRRDARGGPPLRQARPEHRGQGRDERERPRGDQPLRRGGHQDQLHADLHAPTRASSRPRPARR